MYSRFGTRDTFIVIFDKYIKLFINKEVVYFIKKLWNMLIVQESVDLSFIKDILRNFIERWQYFKKQTKSIVTVVDKKKLDNEFHNNFIDFIEEIHELINKHLESNLVVEIDKKNIKNTFKESVITLIKTYKHINRTNITNEYITEQIKKELNELFWDAILNFAVNAQKLIVMMQSESSESFLHKPDRVDDLITSEPSGFLDLSDAQPVVELMMIMNY